MLCDQCQNVEVTASNRRHLLVRVTGARVHTIRAWIFCSDNCQDLWWETSQSDDFLPVTTPAELQPDITLPLGSDLDVHINRKKGPPQTLTVTLTSPVDFDVVSDVAGALGSGAFVTDESGTKAVFSAPDDAPDFVLRVDTVAPQAGDVVTIVYKGNPTPALYDDQAAQDADTRFDRDLNVDVFRQKESGPSVCVEARTHKRPVAVNTWWKTPPVPEEGGSVSSRIPVIPKGPKKL